MIPELTTLRVVPLGGCGEFGRNLTVYDAGEALLAVDCGAQIADDETPGVDRWIPDFTYLASRREQLVAWLLTHAHEDHIAALPQAMEFAPAPIYGRPLTLALLRHSIDESQLHPLVPGAIRQLGPFTVEALHAAHSIPDACAIAITCNGRRVVHTGDFKIDPLAVSATDVARLEALGAEGVDLLVADSTNATRPGRAASETDVCRALIKEIERARGRVAFSLFSSNVGRIAAIFEGCARLKRRVCLEGRGVKEMVAAAISVGELRPAAGLLIDAGTAMALPPSSVAFVMTGSQGEPRSALGRVASGEHPLISFQRGDTLVMSSRPVPGNERIVARMIDKLLASGVTLSDAPLLHASGHACQDELRELMTLVRPRALMPVHGGRRQMFAFADLAESIGVPSIVIVDGDVIELSESGARLTNEQVPVGRRSIEGTAVGDVDHETVKARKRLGSEGVVVVARVGGRVRIEAHGVASSESLPPLLLEAEEAATAILRDGDGKDVAQAVQRAVARVFQQARGKKPRVIALV